MSKFSERYNHNPIRIQIQKDNIDIELKNSLWNALIIHYWSPSGYRSGSWVGVDNDFSPLFRSIWMNHYNLTLDYLPNTSTLSQLDSAITKIREKFYQAIWYEIYDFIEFIANEKSVLNKSKKFQEEVNHLLKREKSAYRFIDGVITEITSMDEIKEIEKALQLKSPFKAVTTHLKTALLLLSDKIKPDYRNSMKESISAVEALCKMILNEPKISLGKALNKIEKKVKIAPALKKGLSSIYGYTSSEDGIRHGLSDEESVDIEDARFMLVMCSTFTNYLKIKALIGSSLNDILLLSEVV